SFFIEPGGGALEELPHAFRSEVLHRLMDLLHVRGVGGGGAVALRWGLGRGESEIAHTGPKDVLPRHRLDIRIGQVNHDSGSRSMSASAQGSRDGSKPRVSVDHVASPANALPKDTSARTTAASGSARVKRTQISPGRVISA